jgi:DivIVA domain-containing protein
VPTPGELRGIRFPLALQGYDPDSVDAAYSAVVDAYEELYVAAGPAAIARAQERLGQRRLDPTGPVTTDAAGFDHVTGVGDEPAADR